MSTRHDKPLWERVWLGRWSKAYLNAGKVIGHMGINATAFFDAVKKLPEYEQYKYESVVRDLCIWEKRERGEYELTTHAKKVLRVILGPAPDDPSYRRWWELRLISVRDMKERGLPVEWAESPPVPLEPVAEEEPKVEKPAPSKKPAAKKKAARRK